MEHAQECCSYMEEHQLMSCTIVVTAMSGAAAALLLGEAARSAAHLLQAGRKS